MQDFNCKLCCRPSGKFIDSGLKDASSFGYQAHGSGAYRSSNNVCFRYGSKMWRPSCSSWLLWSYLHCCLLRWGILPHFSDLGVQVEIINNSDNADQTQMNTRDLCFAKRVFFCRAPRNHYIEGWRITRWKLPKPQRCSPLPIDQGDHWKLHCVYPYSRTPAIFTSRISSRRYWSGWLRWGLPGTEWLPKLRDTDIELHEQNLCDLFSKTPDQCNFPLNQL